MLKQDKQTLGILASQILREASDELVKACIRFTEAVELGTGLVYLALEKTLQQLTGVGNLDIMSP